MTNLVESDGRESLIPAGYTVEFDPPDAIREQVYKIRAEVWQRQATFVDEREVWRDRWDEISTHVVLMKDGEAIGAFRFSLHDSVKTVSAAFPPPVQRGPNR